MSASSICIDGLNRAALLRQAKAGDRESFGELVRPYARSLYRGALGLTASVADAEDVRQETVLKAMLCLEQFHGSCGEGGEDLHAWLSRIGTNTAIDTIRKRRASKLFSIDEPIGEQGESFESTLRSPEHNPEERYLRLETRKKLADAIAALPADLRQTCLLRDVMQYSTREVAEQLGISAMAVRLRLFRAHARLRASLDGSFRRKRRVSQPPLSSAGGRRRSFAPLCCQPVRGFASGD